MSVNVWPPAGQGTRASIDELLKLDEQRRKILAEVESLKAQRNRVSKEIGTLMGQKKNTEAEAKKTETREMGDRITALDQATRVEAARDALMLQFPNLPHASVPEGKTAEDNLEVRAHGKKPAFDFKPKSHVELCESLKLVDFARATKLSGSGFLLYTHWGARLERALIQFLLDLHTREHGYVEVSPPFMVGPQCLEGVGQFPKFEDQYYGVAEGDDPGKLRKLYLIPTAETPVANIHREEILAENQLPVCYCAYTPCFRGEAGAAGVGTRGMIRVHQFDKVELIKITRPENGYAELEKMVDQRGKGPAIARPALPRDCCLHGRHGFRRRENLRPRSLGAGAGELSGSFQLLELRGFSGAPDEPAVQTRVGREQFPHILNGSGTALARLFVALIETHQQPDGSIQIPAPLQPYLKTDKISV